MSGYSQEARRFGMVTAGATALCILGYAVSLILGLISRVSPEDPIGDPMFTILEVLIILLVPLMIGMMIAIHVWAPDRLKVYSLFGVVFMTMLGVVTSGLHFFIAVAVRQAAFTALPSFPLIVEFRWPSVAYILDILAWDIFFPASIILTAFVFREKGLETWIRRSMLISGILAFAGLSGVVTGNMNLRNIGIVGYVGVFFVVTLLLFFFFRRGQPRIN